MALTLAIEGKGVIANADSIATDTAGGSWGVSGSGGASVTLTTDTFYYGSASMSSAVSGSGKHAWIYHDIGAGNELDFGASGTEENQFIYIWVHCPTIGLTDTIANEGVSIRVGSGTGDYRSFIVAGSNANNGWDGKWKCFVIDPTQTGSISDTGTPNLSSIRYIGARIITTGTAKGDNIFVSQIAVGSGIRITGTSTTAWQEAVNYCTDLTNRAWGMLQEREGIYYAYGNIIIGDPVMTGNCSFVDAGRVIQFGLSEYWSGTGTTYQSSLPTTASGITAEDDNTPTSYTTTITDGVIVGTETGRSGSTIIGNDNESVFLDFSGLANAGSDVNLYGTTFKSMTGAITLEGDTDHAYYSVNFVGCAQVNPVGGPEMRNCIFAETVATDGALLWNESIDVEKCQFIANTLGAGIEHPSSAGTPYSYQDLLFSGNTDDVLNSSGSAITVGKLGTSNPTSYDTGGSVVTFTATYTLTLTNIIEGTQVTIVNSSTRTELQNSAAPAGGTVTYDHGGGETVDIMFMHNSYDPNLSDIFDLTLPSADSSAKIQQISDANYVNP